MHSELRNIELKVYNLCATRDYYKNFFEVLGYIILEDTKDHIKFRALNDDLTFYNSDIEISYEGIQNFAIWIKDQNTINNFLTTFVKKYNLEILSDTTNNNTEYSVRFKDPNGITWKIYTNNENNAVIKQELRRNFTKEFIYSFILFPYGLFYAYKLFFRYKHKVAGITCLVITIFTLIFYIYAISSFISSINQAFGNVSDINSQIKQLNEGF